MVAFSLTTSSGTSGSTITTSNDTPFAGEGIFLWTDETGLTFTEEQKEVDRQWDFGDPAAVFKVGKGRNTNANFSRGRFVLMAWENDGSKTVTSTSRDQNGNVSTGTKTVTVQSHDSITWGRDIYVSFAGNFAGFPGAGGSVEHINSEAAWNALTFNTNGETARVTFQDGETMTFTQTKDFAGVGGAIYMVRSAGSNPSTLTNNIGSGALFRGDHSNNGAGQRLVLIGLLMDGQYNPVTGAGPAGKSRLADAVGGNSGAVTDNLLSIFQCEVDGGGILVSGGGGTNSGFSDKCVVDCKARNWPDYAFAPFGPDGRSGVFGFDAQQNPLAILRDTTIGVFPQAADHGPVRYPHAAQTTTQNSYLRSASGWSPLASDSAVQPAVRVHPTQLDGPWEAYIHDCVLGSAWTVINFGPVDSSPPEIVTDGKSQITHNHMISGRQNRGIIQYYVANLAFMNNVLEIPNVASDANANKFVRLRQPVENLNLDAGPVYVGFNTMIAHHTDDVEVIDIEAGAQQVATDEHNIVYAPNAGNGGTFPDMTPLSPMDNFQHTAASAAHNAVTSGFVPYDDFNGNVRGATTSKGAHHGAAASVVNPTPITNSLAPTLAVLANFADEYALSSFGTWAGDVDEYAVEFRIKLNGTLSTDFYRNVFDNTGGEGTGTTLTIDVTFADRIGNRVTAISNGIAL